MVNQQQNLLVNTATFNQENNTFYYPHPGGQEAVNLKNRPFTLNIH